MRVSRFVTGAGVVGPAHGALGSSCCTDLLELLYRAAFVIYAPAARIFAACNGRGVRIGRIHPHDHTPSAPTLHSEFGEVPPLATVGVLAAPLRGDRGSDNGPAHGCRHCCHRSGLAVVGSSIDRGGTATPSRRILGVLRRRVVEIFNYLTGDMAGFSRWI